MMAGPEASARAVISDYLVETGWRVRSRGEAGELWGRGALEVPVPWVVEMDSAPWNRLAAALARADDLPAVDLVDRWNKSLAEAKSDLVPAAERLAGSRLELEVHLRGPSIKGHEASAYDFGVFVMRAADTVKELVKSRRGIRRHGRDLLVVGGPGVGSILVTLREPDHSDPNALLTDAPETYEGQALVFLASVFGAAEKGVGTPELDDLSAHLAPVAVTARRALARLADALVDARWTLNGAIRRGDEEASVRLGIAAAALLSRASREGQDQERNVAVMGSLDGWVWSRSELTLIADELGTIRVQVPMHLQTEVGRLHSEAGNRVAARLAVYERMAAGTRASLQTSYSLLSIKADDQPGLLG